VYEEIRARFARREAKVHRQTWVNQFGWIGVFALNLIVPLSWGLVVTAPDGEAGLYRALVVLWALGAVAIRFHPPLWDLLWVGGLALACSQLFPVIQFGCGWLALLLLQQMGVYHNTLSSETAAMLAVFATAGLLLIPVLAFGGWCQRS